MEAAKLEAVHFHTSLIYMEGLISCHDVQNYLHARACVWHKPSPIPAFSKPLAGLQKTSIILPIPDHGCCSWRNHMIIRCVGAVGVYAYQVEGATAASRRTYQGSFAHSSQRSEWQPLSCFSHSKLSRQDSSHCLVIPMSPHLLDAAAQTSQGKAGCLEVGCMREEVVLLAAKVLARYCDTLIVI